TTLRRRFEAWSIYRTDRGRAVVEPLLSVKLDASVGLIHVTRAIYCYAWEGYHAGDNVYLSRETQKWVRELVGTIHLDHFRDIEELRDELICRLFQAVVGVSRLPLTSVEAPLPEFSLGQLAYFYRPSLDGAEAGMPLQSFQDLTERALHAGQSWLEQAKLVETLLHAVPLAEMGEAV